MVDMYEYTLSQWIIFFFWYCFLGWIWECCYVSVKTAIRDRSWKWVNRGFLNGPALPIYGFAALSILLGTIHVRDQMVLVFFMGALAATAMELVTGSTMERLFHVKYWDYSNLPLNYKGYICFFVSLFWGFLSLFLVEMIHVPVERILLGCPEIAIEIAAFLLIGVFVYDFNDSLRAALDMKELLEKLSEGRIVIERLGNRVNAVIAFTALPDLSDIKELPKTAREGIQYRLEKSRSRHILLHLKHNPSAISRKYKDAFEQLKALLEERKENEKEIK